MNAPESQHGIGELVPRLVIQQDELACLSACLLSQVKSDNIDEQSITRLLTECGLYEEGLGTGLFAAKVLDHSLQKIGLSAMPVFEARLLADDEEWAVSDRVGRVKAALQDGARVVLAYPKRRPGQDPFLHYSVASGCTGIEPSDQVIIMDPSNVDGGIERVRWAEFLPYVTAEEDVPVMAWGVSKDQLKNRVSEEKVEFLGQLGLGLLTNPLYSQEDTGKAIPPGTRHASSVAIPTYNITRQFAELGDVVLSREGEHAFGYPRFVVSPTIRDLSLITTNRFDNLPYPTRQSAEAAAHMENTYGSGTGILEKSGLHWLSGTRLNTDSWQHTGLGISSRQALAVMEGRGVNDLERRAVSEENIKSIIERHTGAKQGDIYLFPTGMAAIYWLNQALIRMSGGAPAIQFGFPYVDTYEQRKYGPGRNLTKNILDLRGGDYDALADIANSGETVRAVITEWPSNALLSTPDLARLDGILGNRIPLVVDDTIGTMFNLDDMKLPPSVAARATSLTKFFSSTGDVMGGSIVLRPESPHYASLKEALGQLYEDTVWYEDAEVLAANGEYFDELMPAINRSGQELAVWLNQNWADGNRALQQVYYPSLNDRQNYDAAKKAGAGYGGLMSLKFKNVERGYRFFDKLRVTKGPSLGTFYTLGCLYTLLAHKPVGSVEKFGLAPDLVRISTGIEDPDDLKQRFNEALERSAE